MLTKLSVFILVISGFFEQIRFSFLIRMIAYSLIVTGVLPYLYQLTYIQTVATVVMLVHCALSSVIMTLE